MPRFQVRPRSAFSLVFGAALPALIAACDAHRAGGGAAAFTGDGYWVVRGPGDLRGLPESVRAVELRSPDGETLAALRNVSRLERLRIEGGGVLADAQLEGAVPRRDLEELWLIDCGRIAAAGLETLAAYPRLRTLHLSGIGIAADGLKPLAASRSLAALSLSGWPELDDAKLGGLAPFVRLERLDLSALRPGRIAAAIELPALDRAVLDGDESGGALPANRVSDAGLEHIAGLERLEVLNLAATAVGDGGVERLAGLRRLRALDLSRTAVTSAAGPHLARLEELRYLELGRTGFGDRGLEALAALSKLERLGLRGAPVGDAGLRALRALTTLRTLDLRRTRASDAALEDLRAALPDCEIVR
jgi:hypothetical protein